MAIDTVNPRPAAPGRPGLSFEAYEQAYHTLCGPDGNPPSQRQLRKYLGTGSNTTLAGYRRRISEQRLTDELPPEAGSLDAQLLATVQRLASQLALDEAQVAQDRVEEIQAEADQRIRIAETTMEKRLQDTALLEHRATTAEATLAELRTENEAKDEHLIELTAELQSTREERATITQSLEDTTRQLAAVTRQNDSLQQTLDQVRAQAIAAAKQQQAEIRALNQTLNKTQANLATATEQYTGLTTRLEERDALIETQKNKLQSLHQRVDQAIESRESFLVRLDERNQEITTLSTKLSGVMGEHKAEQRAHKQSVEQFNASLADKETTVQQLQAALLALAPDEPDTQ